MPTIATIKEDKAIIAEKKVLITSIFFVLFISTADSTDVMTINIEYIKNANKNIFNALEINSFIQAKATHPKNPPTTIRNNNDMY